MKTRAVLIIVVILCVITLLISAGLYIMSRSSQTVGITPTVSIPEENTTETTKVYFSKIPESYDTDFTFVVGVSRVIDSNSPVESSLKRLFDGPSLSEMSDGLRQPIVLTGESNCNSADFKIVSNSTALGSDIEVHLCKEAVINGVGDTARIQSVIKKTLLGLEDSVNFKVGRIAVLNKDNNCLGDESGMNACLR